MTIYFYIYNVKISERTYINVLNSFNVLITNIVKCNKQHTLVISGPIFENKTNLNIKDIEVLKKIICLIESNKINTFINCKVANLIIKSDFIHIFSNISEVSKFVNVNIKNFIQISKNDSDQNGYVKYDSVTNESCFIQIPMYEIFLKLFAKNNNCILPHVNTKHISISYTNCDKYWIEEFQNTVREKYKKNINVINNLSHCNFESKQCKNLSDNIDKILQFVKNQTDIDSVKKLHLEMLAEFQSVSLKKDSSKWSIKYLSWSNIFCYTNDNYIDFELFKDSSLVSLIGDNKTGKSSVIDILIYVLFNVQIRGNKKHMINFNKKNAFIKCCICIDNDEYTIDKTIIKSSSKTKLFKNSEEIKIENPYTFLVNITGTYQKFIDVLVGLQDRKYIADFTADERFQLINRIYGQPIFLQIEKKIKKEIKEINNLGKYTNQIQEKNKSKLQSKLDSLRNKKIELLSHVEPEPTEKDIKYQAVLKDYDHLNFLPTIKEMKKKDKQSLSELENKKIELETVLNSMKNINFNNINFPNQENNINFPNQENNEDAIYLELEQLKSNVSGCSEISVFSEDELLGLLDIYKSNGYDKMQIEKCESKSESIQTDLDMVECGNIDKYTAIISSLKKNICLTTSQASVFKFNKSCEVCDINYNTIEKWSNIPINDKSLIEQYENKIVKILEIKKANIAKYNIIKNELFKINQIKIKNRINLLENELLSKLFFKKKYITEQLQHISDEIIIEKIGTTDQILSKIKNQNSLNIKIAKIDSQIEQAEKKILFDEQIEQSEKNKFIQTTGCTMKKLNEKKHIYDLYYKCICKSGLPSIIVSETCVKLNKICNVLLKQITDFTIEIITNSGININIISSNSKDKLPISLCSGFQKFIIDLVIKIGLSQTSNIVRSNFMILDEGFGCLDKTALHEVLQCLKINKKLFKFIIIISHIQEIHNISDDKINILSNGIFSKIKKNEI